MNGLKVCSKRPFTSLYAVFRDDCNSLKGCRNFELGEEEGKGRGRQMNHYHIYEEIGRGHGSVVYKVLCFLLKLFSRGRGADCHLSSRGGRRRPFAMLQSSKRRKQKCIYALC